MITMDLFDKIEYMDAYEDMRKEHLPLLIFGAGELSSEVEQCLKSKGIIVSDVVVDDDYYDVPPIYIDARIKYSEAVAKYNQFNIVLGHSSYHLYKNLEKREAIRKVFMLPFINYHKWEKSDVTEIRDHLAELQRVYNLLQDEKSKACFVAMLKTHVSGNPFYVLNEFEKPMSFFRNDIFEVDDREVFLDVGAFDGDTLRLFIDETDGHYKQVICIEPDESSVSRLKSYIEEYALKDIRIITEGVWNKKTTLSFLDGQEQISSVSEQGDGTTIHVERIDNLVDGITLLKINYLYGVAEALEGAQKVLLENKPKLAITCGFNCTNIIHIINAVENSNPDYKLYLRFNRGMVSTLTLYGVCE